jgi:spore coat protein A, manganese oxidase
MLSRRELLKVFAVGAGGLLLPMLPRTRAWAQSEAPIDGSVLAKYVDALPIPGVLSPTTPGGNHYEVEISEFSQKLHRDLPKTIVWGYNGSYPGPTFETRKNKPITVEWVNNLVDPKLQLPLDTTIEESPATLPRARVVPHLHGGHILSAWDGIPDAWFTSGSSPVTGPGFYGTTFEYANDQQAATLWYHDHAAGVTRLNVYAGLAGFYLIRDAIEKTLNLPSGPFEIPLVIQDRMFDASGQWFYPDQGVTSEHPIWVPNVFGNIALVNGKVWPYLEVEPRKYRFRILNGSNSRFYNLSLTPYQSFTQIGSEGGLLPEPVELDELLIAPGERADVIVDFAGYAGNKSIVLTNDAPSPFPAGETTSLPEIMQFRVTLPLSEKDTSSLPTRLPAFRRLNPNSATNVRYLTLNHLRDANDKPIILLVGSNVGGLPFSEPVTEKPRDHSTEIWSFLNLTDGTHPMHVHLVQYQVLDRQDFDVDLYIATNGRQLSFTGPRVAPDPNEMGWKDTVRANPGQATRIIVRFDALPTDRIRRFMWHCHILEHEDNDMERPYVLV